MDNTKKTYAEFIVLFLRPYTLYNFNILIFVVQLIVTMLICYVSTSHLLSIYYTVLKYVTSPAK